MANFFVGQRVRLVRSLKEIGIPNWRPTPNAREVELGDEGIVLGTDSRPNPGFLHQPFPVISVHVFRIGMHGITPADCWEPILPEGAAPSEYTFAQLMDNLRGVEA